MNKTRDLFCWSVAVLGWGCWRVHQHGEWECGEGRQDGGMVMDRVWREWWGDDGIGYDWWV